MAAEGSTAQDGNHQGLPSRRWFQAGEYWLCIDVPEGTPLYERCHEQERETLDDLHDAILLDDHESLLRCLELWLQVELDWVPSAEAPLDPILSLQSLSGQQMVTLACKQEQRQTLPAIPAVWKELVQVHWHAIDAQLVLDTFRLSTGELERITTGACILLPASYSDCWFGQLQCGVDASQYANQVVRQCRVGIDAQQAALRIQPSPPSAIVEAETTAEGSCTAQLRVVMDGQITLNVLQGQARWAQGQSWQCLLPQSFESATVGVHLSGGASSPEGTEFSGQLCPIGQGWGVLLGQARPSTGNRMAD